MVGGVGGACARCGRPPMNVAVTPQEHVVRVGQGTALTRVPAMPRLTWGLFVAGWSVWLGPLAYYLYLRSTPTPASSWRGTGLVAVSIVAFLIQAVLWASAFFYSRLVTSDEIAEEAEKTSSGTERGS